MARPRQAGIDKRLLSAWRELSAERDYDAITMTAIAERAGVGKPALYRRFPTKAHVAFAAGIMSSTPERPPDHGSLEADLLPTITALIGSLQAIPRQVYADQISAAIADPVFARRVQDELARPALDQVMRLWERAVERGEVDPEIDGRAALDGLAGAVIFEVMVRHRTPDEDALRALLHRFARAVRASG